MSLLALDNVHVRYPVMNDPHRSLRRAILNKFSGGRIYNTDGRYSIVHALKGLTFTLRDGDRLGLIGGNGAGKSTLLKTIGGFLLPDEGKMTIEGTITSLFSVNSGMDVERTGYDNIFYIGRLFGISKRAMQEHIPYIEEFSELGEFLRLPVRSYSDGMKIRLGFSIITCLKPDILLLDEVIGAGDKHFTAKAMKRAENLCQQANIIVMASHAENILRSLCNKGIWIEQGVVRMFGPLDDVLKDYAAAA